MHERDAHVARSGRGCSFSPHFPCNICIDSDHVHVLFRTNGANPVLRVNLRWIEAKLCPDATQGRLARLKLHLKDDFAHDAHRSTRNKRKGHTDLNGWLRLVLA